MKVDLKMTSVAQHQVKVDAVIGPLITIMGDLKQRSRAMNCGVWGKNNQ